MRVSVRRIGACVATVCLWSHARPPASDTAPHRRRDQRLYALHCCAYVAWRALVDGAMLLHGGRRARGELVQHALLVGVGVQPRRHGEERVEAKQHLRVRVSTQSTNRRRAARQRGPRLEYREYPAGYSGALKGSGFASAAQQRTSGLGYCGGTLEYSSAAHLGLLDELREVLDRLACSRRRRPSGGTLAVLRGYSRGTPRRPAHRYGLPSASCRRVAWSATWPHSLTREIDRSDGRVDRPRTRRRHSAP